MQTETTPKLQMYWLVDVKDAAGQKYGLSEDAFRGNGPSWAALREYIQEHNLTIHKLAIQVGKLHSECPVKDAACYFFGRKSICSIGGGINSDFLGHGYLDEKTNEIIITWCSANGMSSRDRRPMSKADHRNLIKRPI